MKLVGEDINIEKHGIQQEQTFGIHDMGMVLEILRSKLYADPVAAICREITCNARDAHREVGKGNLPIKIVLPTGLDSNYRVIDYGPGISPERMAKVFIQFAASTKRDTNEQTGGFGLGAKTPFAYGDQFGIITIVDGVKRSYSAFIDPTKVGKLVLLHQVPTDEPNGTEIVIPVQPQHFREFTEKTEAATRWWDVLPEVVGDFRKLRPRDEEIIIKGADWKIYKRDGNGYDRHDPQILVDGIAYKFEASIRDNNHYDDKPLSILFNGRKQLIVNFANGLLSLAANRENIHWDQKTKKIVLDRLHEIAEEIRKNLQTEIDACTDYFAAVEKARELTRAFDISNGTNGYFKWQGTPVKSSLDRQYSNGTISTYAVKWRDPNTKLVAEDTKVEKGKGASWEFGLKNMIVINDVGIQHLSPKRAIQILNTLPQTYMELSLVNEKFLESKDIDPYRKYIPFINLSDVVGKKDRKGNVIRKARRLIFKKVGYGTFNLSSADEFEKETGAKVYVMLTRGCDNKPVAHVEGLGYETNNVLDFIATKFKVPIYGFDKAQYDADPEGYEEFTDESIPFKDFVETVAMKDIDIASTRAAAIGWDSNSNRRGEFLDSHVRDMLRNLAKHVDCPVLTKTFEEYVATYTKLDKLREEWRNVQRIAEFVRPAEAKAVTQPSPEYATLRDTYKDICDRFPLLKFFWKDPDYTPDGFVKAMAEYINLKNTVSAVAED